MFSSAITADMVLEDDGRSKKVAVVAHCLLNQNAKVVGFARYPAMVKEVVDILHTNNFGIVQLPCPETTCVGLRRWWATREQYDTPGFKKHCRRILAPTVDMIEEYQKQGYRTVIVGLDGSPSCGVRLSGASGEWGGAPKIRDEEYANYPTASKPGIFMEVLLSEIKERGLQVPPIIGAGFDMPDFQLEDIKKEIGDFLESNS